MRTMFYAMVIINATQEVLERGDFPLEVDADAWITNKREAGEVVGISYGPEFERDLVKEDVSESFDDEMEIEDRSQTRKFTTAILDLIASYNKKNLQPGQVAAIVTNPQYLAVTVMLLAGSLVDSRALIAQIGNAGIYPAPFVAKILALMDEEIERQAPPAPSTPPPEDEESPEGQGE